MRLLQTKTNTKLIIDKEVKMNTKLIFKETTRRSKRLKEIDMYKNL